MAPKKRKTNSGPSGRSRATRCSRWTPMRSRSRAARATPAARSRYDSRRRGVTMAVRRPRPSLRWRSIRRGTMLKRFGMCSYASGAPPVRSSMPGSIAFGPKASRKRRAVAKPPTEAVWHLPCCLQGIPGGTNMKTMASLMTVATFATLAFAGDALAQAKQPAEPKQPGYGAPASTPGAKAVRPTQKPDDLGLWRGSKVIGQNVRDAQGKNIGKIEDVMIDSKGHVPFAVMSFGGFLGMGEKYFAVPWTAMRFDRDGKDVDAVVLDVTKEQLEKAPSFTRDNWPDTRDPKWREEQQRAWGARTDTPRSSTSSDSVITAKVKAKLASEKLSTLTKVDVDTSGGVVQLNGTVDSEKTRMRATDLARQVDGVREVVNNLKVGG